MKERFSDIQHTALAQAAMHEDIFATKDTGLTSPLSFYKPNLTDLQIVRNTLLSFLDLSYQDSKGNFQSYLGTIWFRLHPQDWMGPEFFDLLENDEDIAKIADNFTNAMVDYDFNKSPSQVKAEINAARKGLADPEMRKAIAQSYINFSWNLGHHIQTNQDAHKSCLYLAASHAEDFSEEASNVSDEALQAAAALYTPFIQPASFQIQHMLNTKNTAVISDIAEALKAFSAEEMPTSAKEQRALIGHASTLISGLGYLARYNEEKLHERAYGEVSATDKVEL
jgi:hypothetical protein